jgi:metal-sulfur cluster biosynthetic enzyme
MHESLNIIGIHSIEFKLHQSVYMLCFFIFLNQSEAKAMSEIEEKVKQEVGKVEDPETGQTFEEMQMIQSVKETEPGTVTVEFVPTSPFCPIAFKLAADIRDAAKSVPGVKKAVVFCRGHAMEQQINEMTNK